MAPFHRGPTAQPLPVSGAHNSSHGANANAPNAALLIDFDNVTMGIRSEMLQADLNRLLSSDIIKGKVSVRRAYADWRRYPQYIVPLTESSIDLIFAPAYGSAKKNATDIRLAIDALELVFTRPEIGTFVLLSGDSDFSSMVIKLKEYGKYVIGVGIRESASDLLVMNCDEYYSYNALAGLVKTGEDETTRWDPWQLVTEAITRMKRNGDVMRSDRLKQVMQEIDSSFDEKDLGMSKFSRFVQEAAHKGLLRTTKLENGQLEVDVPLASASAAASVSASDTGTAVVSDPDALQAEPGAPVEVRRERPDRERDDRRGRRGRRGRGQDREPREGEVRDEEASGATNTGEFDVAGNALNLTATMPVAAPPAPTGRAQFTPAFTPAVTAPAATPVAPVAPVAAPSPFGDTATDNIGRGGERLTRVEAFELVRRAVEALVSGEETTSASAVRQKAFEVLGRDSESLSGRNFERILRDSHDADMIDLRRRGNDFEVARAVDAAPIVEQLKLADDAIKAVAAANAPPPPPRGMGHRGVAGRGKGGRGAAAPMDPGMLMMGVVGTPAKTAPTAAPVTPAAAPVVAAEPAPTSASPTPAPVAPEAAAPSAPPAPSGRGRSAPGRQARGPKPAAKPGDKPASRAPEKPAAKTAAKSAKPAAKSATKTAAPAVETKSAGRKAAPAKAPAKKAAKAAKK